MGAVSRKGTRQGDFLAGKYLLEECLGVGGMGEVYRATNVSLGRSVAVKVLNKDMTQNEDDVLRFLREARAAAAVRHPNVVDVLDIMRDDEGTPFIVQELLSGQDLEQHVQLCGGRLTVTEALEVIIPVCDAVAAAHARKVVHRDLKPANIFLAREGTKVTPKVLDFGAALYQTVGGLTAKEQRMLIGTPHYMAPEQITSKKDVDVRADIWAIGVILFEILVGETPFEAESANAVMKKVRTAPITRLRDFVMRAPEALDDLVFKCMQREKTNRYDDAAALREALAAIRDERLAAAKPATSPNAKRERIVTPVEASEIRDVPSSKGVVGMAAVAKAMGPRVPSLELQAVKSAPKRRGSMLLTLSSPDEELPPDEEAELDRILVGKASPPTSTSRPIEAAKPATPQPPSGPRAMPMMEPPPLVEAEKRPSRAPTEPPPPEVVKSVPPDRDDLQLDSASDMAAALELDIPAPSSRNKSSHPTKPVTSPNAFAPLGVMKVNTGPAFVPAKLESNPRLDERATRSSNPTTGSGTRTAALRVMNATERAKLVASIVVPAVVLAAVLHFVTPLLAPVGRALRGETPLAAGVLAVVTLVFAAAIGAKTVSSRSRPLVVAAASAVVLGIVMIVVTFSASESVELGLTPAGAFLVPFLGPVAPISLAVFFGQRASDSWPNPYEKREVYVNVGIASVLALVGLLLGPFGAVLVR